MAFCTFLMLSLAASTGSHLFGTPPNGVPEDADTYLVTMQDSEPFHAGVEVFEDGKWRWAEGRSPDFGKAVQVRLYPDTPWAPVPPKDTWVSRISLDRERESQRRERLRQGWLDAGYQFVGEGKIPILSTEIAKIEEAHRIDEARARPAEAAQLIPMDQDTPPPPPGFLKQFWVHGAVLLAGLVLIVLIAKAYLV